MVKVIIWVKWTLLSIMFLFGTCVHILWTDYRMAIPDPCTAAGEAMGLERVATLAPAGSSYRAMCGGFRNGEWETFRR